jgi:cytochrome c peroxidase
MKHHFKIILLLILIALPLYFMLGNSGSEIDSQNFDNDQEPVSGVDISRDPILPLSPVTGLSSDKVRLGKKLFHDPQLSHDNSISCASCHNFSKGGTDRLRFSVGINGTIGNINAPTVFNSSLNIAQFWDGRTKTLKEQVIEPIRNPAEMGSSLEEVAEKLSKDSEYKQVFQQVYIDGITPLNVADAIANYEKSLVTPNARFDRYLRGDNNAISNDELRGFREFIDHGCASCHQGEGIGGNLFQRFGVMGDYFKDRPFSKADQGRFNVTGLEDDRHVFKVPGLRNVAVTPPYFHDGSVQTLEKAVRVMGYYQLGMDMSEEDIRLIVVFLHTLTGEWEGRVLE